MIDSLPPAAILIVGALLLPLFRGRFRSVVMLALPIVSLAHLLWMFGLPEGNYLQVSIFDYALILMRVDRMALLFGLIFHLVAIFSVIYALHVQDTVQQVAALVYAGAGIAAVFAGDLITLFVYWELTAVSSVFLIWATRTERSYGAGMRYLIIQVGSGVILLAGILFHFGATGSLAFEHLGLGTVGTNLIFVAFGIKCAFPFMHNWLQDAYPAATVTGTVFLSAFTTKLAVYTLARGYAGTGILIGIGVAMTLFPIFYAVIENDLRKVLAYSLNNQLGFMVVGIGIGTHLSLNGTCAHAFAHIMYKALLFMTMGAVLHRTGTTQASRLGGLYKSMPLTAFFCLIGAMSIAGMPLLSGFVSKSMILTAAGDGHFAWVYLALLIASAGVMEHSGIKIPYFAFFGHDSGIRCKEAPLNMLIGMGLTAAMCILIGVWPAPLYALLPFVDVQYVPYTTAHVVTTLQLVLWATLAFAVLMRTRLYPAEVPSVNLDFDWIYRRLFPRMYHAIAPTWNRALDLYWARTMRRLETVGRGVYRAAGPDGLFSRSWPVGSTVMWVALILGAILVFYFSRAT